MQARKIVVSEVANLECEIWLNIEMLKSRGQTYFLSIFNEYVGMDTVILIVSDKRYTSGWSFEEDNKI